VHKRLR